MSFCVVLVTLPTAKVAQKLARNLVRRKLAACVNIISNATSIYRWEGRINKDRELLLIIKTRTTIFKKLSAFITTNHPAQVPEIIRVPIMGGNPTYIDWLADNTISSKRKHQ